MEPVPAASDPGQKSRGTPVVVSVLAAVAQVGVLFITFVFGLQWGDWTWLAALLQAMLLGIALAALALRRSWLVIAVPIASFALSLGLFVVFVQTEIRSACSPEQLAATAELAPPAGADVRFKGEAGNGCIARFTADASPDEVIAHYRSEFGEHGWEITGQELAVIIAVKDGIVMNVEVVAQEGGLVIVTVDDAT